MDLRLSMIRANIDKIDIEEEAREDLKEFGFFNKRREFVGSKYMLGFNDDRYLELRELVKGEWKKKKEFKDIKLPGKSSWKSRGLKKVVVVKTKKDVSEDIDTDNNGNKEENVVSNTSSVKRDERKIVENKELSKVLEEDYRRSLEERSKGRKFRDLVSVLENEEDNDEIVDYGDNGDNEIEYEYEYVDEEGNSVDIEDLSEEESFEIVDSEEISEEELDDISEDTDLEIDLINEEIERNRKKFYGINEVDELLKEYIYKLYMYSGLFLIVGYLFWKRKANKEDNLENLNDFNRDLLESHQIFARKWSLLFVGIYLLNYLLLINGFILSIPLMIFILLGQILIWYKSCKRGLRGDIFEIKELIQNRNKNKRKGD